MKIIVNTLLLLVPLTWLATANAQTDALVVDSTGNVGVNTLSPDESIRVVAALKAPFVELPARCGLNIPVRIIIKDALTADNLLLQEAILSEASRLLSATLPPASVSTSVQVGVLTDRIFVNCLTKETTAVGPMGIRRLD